MSDNVYCVNSGSNKPIESCFFAAGDDTAGPLREQLILEYSSARRVRELGYEKLTYIIEETHETVEYSACIGEYGHEKLGWEPCFVIQKMKDVDRVTGEVCSFGRAASDYTFALPVDLITHLIDQANAADKAGE